MEIFRENTPLTSSDCFMIFSREKSCFDFPLHTHNEIELNLVLNAKGASRVIGNHVGEIDDAELVMIGSDIPHTWMTDNCRSGAIREVTIQFHADLFDAKLMQRNQMATIRRMFEKAGRGLLFTPETARAIAPRIMALYEQSGSGGMSPLLGLLSILNELSLAPDVRMLSDASFTLKHMKSGSRRIENVFDFMNKNFNRQISLAEVAEVANMSEVSFSRFIKKYTGHSFVDTLTEIRLGHVTRLLIDTDMTIAEIAFCCGFNNMANFNRIFKRKKGSPPHKFRKMFMPKKLYV